MHPNFKINEQPCTSSILRRYTEEMCLSKVIYLQEIGAFFKDWINENDFVIVQTSGSTGKPKRIKLQKQHMINSALATGEYFNVKKNTKALLCLSANYIAGKMMLVRAMVLGWDIYLVAPSSSPLKNISDTFDFCAMVPLQVENSLENLQQVKQLIIGGAPISSSLLSKIQVLNTQCFATYGMTETITHIAVKRLNSTSKYYEALPNVILSKDDRNCLVIDAPKVASKKIVTNDVVQLISNTQFEWLGRLDNVINSGGVKLFPEQIEEKLATLITNRFFVTGVFDVKLGQKLVLLIETENEIIVDEVKLKSILSIYEIPKKTYYIPKFIETPTGKINRMETLKLM